MSAISASTPVFIWAIKPSTGQRNWAHGFESRKDRNYRLVLWPLMSSDSHAAKSFRYDYAVIVRRRAAEELQCDYHFSLTPDGEEVAQQDRGAPDQEGREVTFFNGIVVRPFSPRGWCIKFPGTAIETMRADTVQDVYERVKERNLLGKAEKAPAPPPEPEPEPETIPQPRLRPGDLYGTR
jgi:hypothetical protein